MSKEFRKRLGSGDNLNILTNTVDGRNPAPPWMYKTFVINGIFTVSTGAGILSINSRLIGSSLIYQLPKLGHLLSKASAPSGD